MIVYVECCLGDARNENLLHMHQLAFPGPVYCRSPLQKHQAVVGVHYRLS